jgi:hypothetical protein
MPLRPGVIRAAPRRAAFPPGAQSPPAAAGRFKAAVKSRERRDIATIWPELSGVVEKAKCVRGVRTAKKGVG